MTDDSFPYDELWQLGLEPVPLKPPAPSIPPGPHVPLASKHAGDRAMRDALDCLAEIVYGGGYRLPIYHRARAALETLGITKRPESKSDADDGA